MTIIIIKKLIRQFICQLEYDLQSMWGLILKLYQRAFFLQGIAWLRHEALLRQSQHNFGGGGGGGKIQNEILEGGLNKK